MGKGGDGIATQGRPRMQHQTQVPARGEDMAQAVEDQVRVTGHRAHGSDALIEHMQRRWFKWQGRVGEQQCARTARVDRAHACEPDLQAIDPVRRQQGFQWHVAPRRGTFESATSGRPNAYQQGGVVNDVHAAQTAKFAPAQSGVVGQCSYQGGLLAPRAPRIPKRGHRGFERVRINIVRSMLEAGAELEIVQLEGAECGMASREITDQPIERVGCLLVAQRSQTPEHGVPSVGMDHDLALRAELRDRFVGLRVENRDQRAHIARHRPAVWTVRRAQELVGPLQHQVAEGRPRMCIACGDDRLGGAWSRNRQSLRLLGVAWPQPPCKRSQLLDLARRIGLGRDQRFECLDPGGRGR